jgi:hypothetical protein
MLHTRHSAQVVARQVVARPLVALPALSEEPPVVGVLQVQAVICSWKVPKH